MILALINIQVRLAGLSLFGLLCDHFLKSSVTFTCFQVKGMTCNSIVLLHTFYITYNIHCTRHSMQVSFNTYEGILSGL